MEELVRPAVYTALSNRFQIETCAADLIEILTQKTKHQEKHDRCGLMSGCPTDKDLTYKS